MTKSLLSKHFVLMLIIITSNKSFSNVPKSDSISEHLNFITKTKNSNDAFVSFQRIIEKDVKNKNYSKINEKIEIYKKVFIEKFENFDSTRFEQLYEIINSEDEDQIKEQIEEKENIFSRGFTLIPDSIFGVGLYVLIILFCIWIFGDFGSECGVDYAPRFFGEC